MSECFPHTDDAEVIGWVSLVQGGDRQERAAAFSKLEERYRPLIASSVLTYLVYDSSGDRDTAQGELEEEARVALFHAALTYKVARGLTFGYYAKVCIRNRLISYLRKAAAREHLAYSLPEESDAALPSAEETVLDRLAFRELSDRFFSSLTTYERRVFDLYIRGLSHGEIAKRLSAEEKSVDNAVYRFRRKLRQAMDSIK